MTAELLRRQIDRGLFFVIFRPSQPRRVINYDGETTCIPTTRKRSDGKYRKQEHDETTLDDGLE